MSQGTVSGEAVSEVPSPESDPSDSRSSAVRVIPRAAANVVRSELLPFKRNPTFSNVLPSIVAVTETHSLSPVEA